ncbi:MAG: hypothetical protein ACPG4X_19680 [Pikeienuella sp.]
MATGTAGDTGQVYHTNQVHYLSKTVTYTSLNASGAGSGTANKTVVIGELPPHAIVVPTLSFTKVITGFDDTTADDIDIGVEGGDDDLFASAVDANAAATTAFDDLATANDYSATARTVTCNFTTAPTGDGTAGEAIVVLSYVVARDQ